MKVSLSASYWQDEKVAEVLHSCDVIFTSNEIALEDIKEKFGNEKVIPVRDNQSGTLHAMRMIVKGMEVVTFSDILKIKDAV